MNIFLQDSSAIAAITKLVRIYVAGLHGWNSPVHSSSFGQTCWAYWKASFCVLFAFPHQVLLTTLLRQLSKRIITIILQIRCLKIFLTSLIHRIKQIRYILTSSPIRISHNCWFLIALSHWLCRLSWTNSSRRSKARPWRCWRPSAQACLNKVRHDPRQSGLRCSDLAKILEKLFWNVLEI